MRPGGPSDNHIGRVKSFLDLNRRHDISGHTEEERQCLQETMMLDQMIQNGALPDNLTLEVNAIAGVRVWVDEGGVEEKRARVGGGDRERKGERGSGRKIYRSTTARIDEREGKSARESHVFSTAVRRR